ncbi:MAG: 1,4-beta-xylanase, partial [Chitinophagaceae bacterium]|nr:1,4-beta-xylanase [Chitinophagaceae bacterium]
MQIKYISLIALALGVLFTGCFNAQKSSSSRQVASLKDRFKDDFLIGTALNAQQIEEKDPVADKLIKQQFNA